MVVVIKVNSIIMILMVMGNIGGRMVGFIEGIGWIML